MSTITLTAISAFSVKKPAGELQIAFGASTGFIDAPTGRRVLVMGNVPLASGFRAPSGGLLLLYGFRDAMDEVKLRRAEAAKDGLEFHYADVSVEVGHIQTGVVDADQVRDLRFVNVRRMTALLQEMILDRFSEYVGYEMGNEVGAGMTKVHQIATRPDLFARLLDEFEPLKNIEVLVIPVADNPDVPGRVRQMAYVRNGAQVVRLEQNSEVNEFVLPTSLQP